MTPYKKEMEQADLTAAPFSLDEDDRYLPTRASLLARIKDTAENESWKEFFNTYWKLIYNTALRKGLFPSEAQEVIQETMIQVSRKIPEFKYDPKKGSFKSWLMKLVYWRITDQYRRRKDSVSLDTITEMTDGTEDPNWDEEWEKNLVANALERVRQKTKPKHFQIYTFCVLQEKGPKETALLFNTTVALVYVVKHRISAAVVAEMKKLREGGL